MIAFPSEERLIRLVIVRRARAIFIQALCLALNFVCLAEAISQTNSILNSTDVKSVKSEADQLLQSADELCRKKDYDAALPLLDRCLSLKEKGLGRDDQQIGEISFLIGGLYREKGEWTRALPYLQRSLGIKEKLLGKDSPELTTILVMLGLTCKAEQLNTAAIDYFERCLVIQDEHPNQDNKYTHSLLDALADLYRLQANYGKALAALQRSQTIKEHLFGKESTEVANCIHKMALIYEDLGDYPKAQSLFELGLQLRQTHPSEDGQMAICLRDLAHLAQKRSDLRSALALYQRAAAIAERLPENDGATIAGILGSLAGLYRELGNLASALDLYERCVAILEKQNGPQHPSLASALGNLANLKAELGQYDEALALHKRSLAITERAYGKESQQYAVCLGDMAQSYGTRGDFAEELGLEEQSLGIFEKVLGPNHPQVAAMLGNIGNVESYLGNYVDSMKHLRRSLSINENAFGRQSLDVATTLNNLAVILGLLGDSKTQLSLSEESVTIIEKLMGIESPSAAKMLGNLGLAYEQQGQHSKALSCYLRSLALTEKIYGYEHREVARLLNNIADLNQAMGDSAKAEDYYQRSLSIGVKLLGEADPSVVVIMNNLASLLYSSGKTADGIAMFVRVAQLQRANMATQLNQLRGNNSLLFLSHMFYQAEMLHSACAEAAQHNFLTARIAGAEQLALNKAFLEEIQATFAALEVDPETSTQTLREQYATVQNELAHFSKGNLDPATRDLKHRELQDQLNQLEAQLAERVGFVTQMIHERNLTLTDIARSLPPQSALVDFIQYRRYDFKANEWKEQRYAAYLTFPLGREATNVAVERVDLGQATPINEAVELVCKRMSAGQFAAKDSSPTLQRLGDLVYSPAATYLANVSHLIICPDGQLNRLPFELLAIGNKFLVEEKTISYVTSGREIVRVTKPKSKFYSSKSLVMGNPDFDLALEVAHAGQPASQLTGLMPVLLSSGATRALSRDERDLKFKPLPSSAVEAMNVAGLLGTDATLRLGADAREAKLKSIVSPRVLHLATHGFYFSDQEFKYPNSGRAELVVGSDARQSVLATNIDWENPLVRCGIALAGANHAREIANPFREDGLLTGLEASLLKLEGTELVILSACDSGSGDVKIGEGVMSLQRAFRIAGAESVLASHWKVNDRATSELMTEFIRRWRSGEPRAQAWREAQLALLHSKDFSNPFFWAAFTLTGQWR